MTAKEVCQMYGHQLYSYEINGDYCGFCKAQLNCDIEYKNWMEDHRSFISDFINAAKDIAGAGKEEFIREMMGKNEL